MSAFGVHHPQSCRPLAVLLGSLLLLSSLSSAAQPTSQASSQPAGELVASIDVRLPNAQLLAPDTIRALLQQKVGAPIDEEAIREDIKAIFALGGVYDVQVELDAGVLRYNILELPESVDFEIKGDKPKHLNNYDYIPVQYFYSFIAINKKEATSLSQLKKSSQEVQENLRKFGYMNATVTSEINVRIVDERKYLNEVLVTYTISLGPKFIISEVNFIGNKELSTKSIRENFVTRSISSKRMQKKYGGFSTKLLENDIISLKAKYLEKGFLDADISIKEVIVDDKSHLVKISVNIVEGQQYKLDTVSLDSSYEGVLIVKPGGGYNTSDLKADIANISGYFQDNGYADVSVDPQVFVDKSKKTVSVHFKVEKGELFYFGEIFKDFPQVKRLPSDSFIEFKTGELYSRAKLERTRKNLENTQNLNAVRITTEVTEQPKVLDVTIQSSFRDIVGGRLIASADLEKPYWIYHRGTVNNWFGYRNIVESQYRLFDNERTFAFGVSRFFSRGTGLSVSGFDSDYQWPLQTFRKLGGSIQVSQRFSESLSGFLVYALYQDRSKLSSALLPASLDGDGRRATLLAGLAFDSRDFGVRSTLDSAGGFVGRGWYLSARGALDAAWLGSTQELLGVHLRGARFFTLRDGGRQANVPGGITLKLLGRYDRRWSLSDEEIPYTERFLLGGIGTVRGFGLQSLGTQIEDGGRALTIGGAHAYSGTMELELPFVDGLFDDWWRRFRWALFVDAGHAFDRAVSGFPVIAPPQDFGRLPVRTSAGLSLRWYMPYLLGPVRLDVARPLDAQPGEGLQVHFSISTEL